MENFTETLMMANYYKIHTHTHMGRNKFSRCEWKLSYANKVNLHFKIHQIAKACLNNCKIHFSLKAKKKSQLKEKLEKTSTHFIEFFLELWPKNCIFLLTHSW